jgi:hypothetical protein
MQWAGTGKRVRDRLELVLDPTTLDPAVPLRVLYNAEVHNQRVHGFLSTRTSLPIGFTAAWSWTAATELAVWTFLPRRVDRAD